MLVYDTRERNDNNTIVQLSRRVFFFNLPRGFFFFLFIRAVRKTIKRNVLSYPRTNLRYYCAVNGETESDEDNLNAIS